uniref:Uncharacterized protein n=1 Tax=Anguilla anguilla TaxID=7936 RepID=A0A0E9UF97_ANGAN
MPAGHQNFKIYFYHPHKIVRATH